ncbi:hypothetical protein NECAME_18292, partial [Necator americanus]
MDTFPIFQAPPQVPYLQRHLFQHQHFLQPLGGAHTLSASCANPFRKPVIKAT